MPHWDRKGAKLRSLGASSLLALFWLACSSEPSEGGPKSVAGGRTSTGNSNAGGRPSTNGGASTQDGGTAGSRTGGASASGGQASSTLSQRYPNDEGLADDPAVLFFDDFEADWGRWDAPQADTQHLTIQSADSEDSKFLRSRVSQADLDQDEYISSSTRTRLARAVPELYFRYRTRFVGRAPNPHHWVRIAAGNEGFQSSGLANTVPAGNEGFWFDFDVKNDDTFNFYAYWHLMRSGRCNDGSVTPGCEGDQGTTYHYGNNFSPAAQTAFDRDQWLCIEMRARANHVGDHDGLLAFWRDDVPVGEFAPGTPVGTWLRDTFFTEGCAFSACTEPAPFEGLEFRSSEDVNFKEIFLDAYYERGTFADKKAALEQLGIEVDTEAIIDYDDVVVATERIGCKVPQE